MRVGTEASPATSERETMLASALGDDVVPGVTFTALDEAAAKGPPVEPREMLPDHRLADAQRGGRSRHRPSPDAGPQDL